MTRRSTTPIHPITAVLVGLLLVGGFALASLLDGTILRALHLPGAEREDWNRMFRVMGYWPTWILAGIAASLIHRPHAGERMRSARPALCIILSTASAGLLAEGVKLLVRRLRPDIDHAGYQFRSFAVETWSTSGLGMPSSHVAVAFAGAITLCILAPRASGVWLLLAAGCAFTRLADRAHWLSDAYVGAMIGVLIGWWVSRALRPGVAGGFR